MIRINKVFFDEIVKQALDELPNEACGLLAGKYDEVIKRYPMTNIDESPEHFSFDPTEQFKVLRQSRSEGLKLIANYHSHPSTPARPSQEDIRLAFDSEIVYLILSLAGETPDLKGFKIKNGEVEAVEVVISF